MVELTAERLRDLFDYDEATGVFTRRFRRGPTSAGKPAGTKNGRGYVQIMVDGRIYMAHRLAWLHMTGSWPTNQIDHINRMRGENHWRNLREVSQSENLHNRDRQRNNSSGFLGVYASGHRWTSGIDVDGLRHYLGTFGNPRDAAAAYAAKKQELGRGVPDRP